MYLIRSLVSSVSSFFRDECHHLAASMTYFLILSIVPLGLLLVSLFGHILGENQELYRYLLSKLTTFFPDVTSGITDELTKLITYKGISIITFFIYGFFALQLFYSAEHAMDVIFRVPKKRHFLFSLLWTLFIVTLVIFFWVVSFTVSSLASMLPHFPVTLFDIGLKRWVAISLGYIAPFILIMFTATTVYKIVPHVKVGLKNAFYGALLFTVLGEGAKHLFTWMVKHVSYIGTIYGSLTTFIIFLLWMYYVSCIFLLGGEFVNSLSRRS
jgi:YihY family inner membrane protein